MKAQEVINNSNFESNAKKIFFQNGSPCLCDVSIGINTDINTLKNLTTSQIKTHTKFLTQEIKNPVDGGASPLYSCQTTDNSSPSLPLIVFTKYSVWKLKNPRIVWAEELI